MPFLGAGGNTNLYFLCVLYGPLIGIIISLFKEDKVFSIIASPYCHKDQLITFYTSMDLYEDSSPKSS